VRRTPSARFNLSFADRRLLRFAGGRVATVRPCRLSRRDGLDRLADRVSVLVEQHLPDDLLDRHVVGTGHAAPPFVKS
jgi:hypothetical protein